MKKSNNIKQTASNYGVPIIRNISHDILVEKVKETNPDNILEVGTAIGYSGIAMLENSNAKLMTIEHNLEYIKQAKQNFKNHKLTKRVKIKNGDCMVILANLCSSKKYNEFFDFIFLDGPKAQYDNMLELLLLLLKPNGLLVADNVLFRGYVEEGTKPKSRRYKTIIERLNQFIEKCKNHPELYNFELNNTEDGMIFVKKRAK